MAQTAGSWLENELSKYDIHKPISLSNWDTLKQLVSQAKVIEKEKMIEFAKLHVEAALKAASEVHIKVEKKSQHGKYRKWQTVKEGEEVDLFNYHMQYSQDKKSILNAYPLENIK